MNKHLHMMEKVTYIKENGLQSSKTVMEELYKWSELECLRKHVKFRLFKVYGIAELSQDGIEESDIDAELYFAFCKAVERYQLHDDLPETEEEKMFITYCHRYMDGDVKRFIEKENRISHYYTWLLMRIKANGYDVFSNTEECIEIIRDTRKRKETGNIQPEKSLERLRKALIEKDYLTYDASLMLPYEDERLPYEQLIEILHAKFTKDEWELFYAYFFEFDQNRRKTVVSMSKRYNKSTTYMYNEIRKIKEKARRIVKYDYFCDNSYMLAKEEVELW